MKNSYKLIQSADIQVREEPRSDTLQKKGIERVKRLYNQNKNYNQYIELFKKKMR